MQSLFKTPWRPNEQPLLLFLNIHACGFVLVGQKKNNNNNNKVTNLMCHKPIAARALQSMMCVCMYSWWRIILQQICLMSMKTWLKLCSSYKHMLMFRLFLLNMMVSSWLYHVNYVYWFSSVNNGCKHLNDCNKLVCMLYTDVKS